MMGERRVGQDALFYEFSLERHVPVDHLLRSIDRFVDLSGVRAHLRPFYSEIGRPSIDPELMIRMLLVGYCFGIRSERRLCEEVHLNLAYRWFCRLGLQGGVPDHSTFSKNRHGRFHDCDLLRKLFETTVQRCISEGLDISERSFAQRHERPFKPLATASRLNQPDQAPLCPGARIDVGLGLLD
jgi:transposase